MIQLETGFTQKFNKIDRIGFSEKIPLHFALQPEATANPIGFRLIDGKRVRPGENEQQRIPQISCAAILAEEEHIAQIFQAGIFSLSSLAILATVCARIISSSADSQTGSPTTTL